MLACYRAQDWAGARAALAECREYSERLGGFYDLYAERIEFFEANPPGPAWTGYLSPKPSSFEGVANGDHAPPAPFVGMEVASTVRLLAGFPVHVAEGTRFC